MLSIEETLKCKCATVLADFPCIEVLVSCLDECKAKKDLALAMQVHTCVCNVGLDLHGHVGNYVVRMFAACGNLPTAQQAFMRLPCPNVYSWTSLMLGFGDYKKWRHVFLLYHNMKQENVHPNSYTFMALLQACAGLHDAHIGRKIHVEIVQLGHEACAYVGCSLVCMYAKCRLLLEAKQVTKKLSKGSLASWNALISGYTEDGQNVEAMECLEQMEREAIHPDIITLVSVLKACGSKGEMQKVYRVHLKLVKQGMEGNSIAGNALVDTYAKSGVLIEAQNVFDHLTSRDFVAWTALISGYIEFGQYQEALTCFEQFQFEDTTLDATMFSCVLKLCGSIGAVEKGLELHNELYSRGVEGNLHVGSTLVGMYAKCGCLLEAREVLNKQPVRNTVVWNALINGYGVNEAAAPISFKKVKSISGR